MAGLGVAANGMRSRTLIGVLATVVWLVGAPGAPETPGVQPTTYQAEFAPLRRSERNMRRLGPVGPYYPQVAVESQMSGEATLECRAGELGTLEACKILSETPPGFYFGAAAARMAQAKRITVQGSPPLGETIWVRVPFTLGAPASVAR